MPLHLRSHTRLLHQLRKARTSAAWLRGSWRTGLSAVALSTYSKAAHPQVPQVDGPVGALSVVRYHDSIKRPLVPALALQLPAGWARHHLRHPARPTDLRATGYRARQRPTAEAPPLRPNQTQAPLRCGPTTQAPRLWGTCAPADTAEEP